MARLVLALSLVAGCGAQPEAPAAPAAVAGAPTVAAEVGCGEEDRSAVVAKWEGGSITLGEVLDQIDADLKKMEVEHLTSVYDAKVQGTEQLVVDRLLSAEAKSRGLADTDALLKVEVEDKVAPPTEQQVADLYPLAKRQFGNASLDEVRPYLEAELTRRARVDRFQAYMEELKAAKGVTTSVPFPNLPRIDIPVADTDPIRGNKDAPVTIVQFAEYECYYCGKVAPTIDRLLQTYDGKVRLVFKDFPLAMHANARGAAVAAHCAGEQGKYWDMNHTLLSNQKALTSDDFARYATTLGLDGGKFSSCLTSGRYDSVIDAGIEAGRAAGVEATPTFYIDGVLVSGAQPYERFAALIDRELQSR